ncbi:MAG: MazG family protein [Planctomycetota bacterium]|jgi:MazG family protein
MSDTKPSTRPLSPPELTGESRTDGFKLLMEVIDRLRADDGCPWDLEQTVASLAPSLIEEAFEAVEVIEAGDTQSTCEELGDLFMVIALISKISAQNDQFDFGDIARSVANKLVRRHPHVFGDSTVESTDEVLENWEAIKERERAERKSDTSAVAGVPKALPALQRASRIGGKAMTAGFRWTNLDGALAKLEEEVREVREAIASGDSEAIEHELGDVLLAGAMLGNYVKVDAETAARSAVRRFEDRFRRLEAELGSVRGKDLDELMAAWERAKLGQEKP